jgi:hypothetical protein
VVFEVAVAVVSPALPEMIVNVFDECITAFWVKLPFYAGFQVFLFPFSVLFQRPLAIRNRYGNPSSRFKYTKTIRKKSLGSLWIRKVLNEMLRVYESTREVRQWY